MKKPVFTGAGVAIITPMFVSYHYTPDSLK